MDDFFNYVLYSRRRRRRRARRHSKRHKLLVSASLVCFLVLVTYLAFQFSPVERDYMYPFPYRKIIERYAAYYHVDSTMVAAVIKTESSFRDNACSHRGALGLMQIMPSTGAWIAEQLEDKAYSEDKLTEPERNIHYGVWYLHSLEQEFHGNPVLVLAAYNAGRGNVRDWIEKRGWDMNFHDVDAIPFPETKRYVKQVMETQKKYNDLYPEE